MNPSSSLHVQQRRHLFVLLSLVYGLSAINAVWSPRKRKLLFSSPLILSALSFLALSLSSLPFLSLEKTSLPSSPPPSTLTPLLSLSACCLGACLSLLSIALPLYGGGMFVAWWQCTVLTALSTVACISKFSFVSLQVIMFFVFSREINSAETQLEEEEDRVGVSISPIHHNLSFLLPSFFFALPLHYFALIVGFQYYLVYHALNCICVKRH